MELIGIILRAGYYKLEDNGSTKVIVLPVQTLGDSFMIRAQLTKNWKPGRSFHIAEKNKSFLVWNNETEKLRLISDGCWIQIQRIQSRQGHRN